MPAADDEERDQSAPPRLRLGIGAAVTLGLVVLSAAVGWGILRGQAAPSETVSLDGHGGEASVSAPAGIYVHVLGEVQTPGLYLLAPDARLVDALAAAGGSLKTADLRAVNLARPLTDGEQIVVPAEGDVPDTPETPGVVDGKVDLNTADLATLETLPRIGPALAQRIIDWREQNGGFRSVDDLLAVPGIGEKLMEGLREQVRV